MKYLLFSLVAFFASVFTAAGFEYTVMPVHDIPLSGNVWDLSRCEPSGPEFDIKLRAGDSVQSYWNTFKRFDFVNCGDSTLQCCAETRQYRTIFKPGILCRRLPDGGMTLPFSFRGRIYQSEFVNGTGITSISESAKGSLVTHNGDLIGAAASDHSRIAFRWVVTTDSVPDIGSMPDSAFCVTTVDRYMLTAIDEDFPQAYKCVTITRLGEDIIEADSTAWVLTYSPDAARQRTERQRHFVNRLQPSDSQWTHLQVNGNDDISIAVTGEMISISASGSDLAGESVDSNRAPGLADVVITDIIGRMYMTSRIDLAIGGDISISSLPGGEYLIQVIPENGTPAASKFIK